MHRLHSALVAALALAMGSTSAFAAFRPSVTTLSATAITASTATINGTVNPRNAAATVGFGYGTTTADTVTVSSNPASLAANSGSTSVKADLAGLKCATTYYFKAGATNSAGTTLGTQLSFTTGACPTSPPSPPPPPPPPAPTAPAAITNPATTTSNAATLNASVTPNGAITT